VDADPGLHVADLRRHLFPKAEWTRILERANAGETQEQIADMDGTVSHEKVRTVFKNLKTETPTTTIGNCCGDVLHLQYIRAWHKGLYIHRAPAIARQSLLCRVVCPDCALIFAGFLVLFESIR